jgi:hypothetical protein
MNKEVSCANCVVQGRLPTGQIIPMNRPMEFIGQYPVRGVHTFAFHCLGCNGKAYLQQQRDPRSGRGVLVPVHLVGADAEYQPNHVKPRESVQIPIAYTLGATGRAGHHIPIQQPITTPSPSIQLDPRISSQTMITPDHPMHPDNVRKRIQPVSLSDFLGR